MEKTTKNYDIILRKCFKENLPEGKWYVICNEDIQSPYYNIVDFMIKT